MKSSNLVLQSLFGSDDDEDLFVHHGLIYFLKKHDITSVLLVYLTQVITWMDQTDHNKIIHVFQLIYTCL